MKKEIKERIEAVRRGEMPEDYCKAHPYVIPNDWKVVKLGNITKRTSRPNKDGQDRPAYSINNRKGFVPQSEQFEEGSYEDLDKSAYKIVRKGEFAYNPARVNVGSIGRLRDAEEVAVSSLYVCVSVDDKVDGEYFDAWTKSWDFYKETVRNTEGSVREYLFYENFANMRMPIPSFAEQQRIAEILATCDRVIELKQQLLEEKQRQKRAYLQKLLPQNGSNVPEWRLPGFSTPWKSKKLGELVTFYGGLTYSPDDVMPEGTLVLRSSNVKDGEIVDADNVYVDSAAVNSENVQIGDIIVVVRNGSRALIGKHAEIKSDMPNTVIGAFMTGIRSEYPPFVNVLLSTPQFDAEVQKNLGAAINQITGYMFAKMEFMVPEPAERVAIGEFFRTIDDLIALYQQELEKEKQKKKALMQLLLTGLVRVNA